MSPIVSRTVPPIGSRLPSRCGAGRTLCALVLMLTSATSWASDTSAPIDLRMVVETSAAMGTADPQNLRGQGLELLIRGRPDASQAGLWSYSRHTTQVARYESVSALWRQVASIHAGSLRPGSSQADLPGALQAATWDFNSAGRGRVHLVLLATGGINLGGTDEKNQLARRDLLAAWGADLARQRITLHAIGFSADGADADLLKQLAELSGGLYRPVSDAASLNAAVLDIQNMVMTAPQARVDEAGRFQIAPGAERFTVLWFLDDAADEAPELEQPGGARIGRLTPLPGGRWLRAQQFEVATIEAPQPGWWRVVGPTPDRVQVYGEIGVQVDGLDSPLVPSEDSSVHITLYDNGRQIRDPAFLGLLDVRAWAIVDGERMPLPIDPTDGGFEAFFVNLHDGAHQFEVDVIAPTFSRVVSKPFVVSNPLRVEIREHADGGAAAWLHFSHPEVDYATVRTAALVRKPPQIATLIPGVRMPAGIWQIPLEDREGIVEIAFSIAGNYLDGKGVYVKTKPHALQLPLAPGSDVTLRYDAQGKLLSVPERPPAVAEASVPAPDAAAVQTQAATGSAAEVTPEVTPVPPETPPAPLIPLWFVGVISLLNLALAGFVWWLFKPAPLELAAPA